MVFWFEALWFRHVVIRVSTDKTFGPVTPSVDIEAFPEPSRLEIEKSQVPLSSFFELAAGFAERDRFFEGRDAFLRTAFVDIHGSVVDQGRFVVRISLKRSLEHSNTALVLIQPAVSGAETAAMVSVVKNEFQAAPVQIRPRSLGMIAQAAV